MLTSNQFTEMELIRFREYLKVLEPQLTLWKDCELKDDIKGIITVYKKAIDGIPLTQGECEILKEHEESRNLVRQSLINLRGRLYSI